MSGSDRSGVGGGGKRARGRPPAFDRATAVERAMRVFWERGYEGASFNALTETMGMSASSLQNAFGSKEALFREAVRHYSERVSAWYADALAAPSTAREAVETLIAAAAAAFTRPDLPAGCMVSTAAIRTPPDLIPVREFATLSRRASQSALADRIRRGIAGGDVAADTDADALAAYLGTVLRGMAVQACDGATRAELLAIGAHAMRAWPAGGTADPARGSRPDPGGPVAPG